MNQKVALCTMCNPAAPTPKKKRGKKKAKGQWDSDDEDESDGPTYPPGIMKPDITFFGEKLTDEFDNSLAKDRERVDLLLVIGTSLKVSPVADILCVPFSSPLIGARTDPFDSPPSPLGTSGKYTSSVTCYDVPAAFACSFLLSQILINKTPIRHINPDVYYLLPRWSYT
ncbi:hypothetical protein H0H87_004402 [Tephrocybe sp. NHM501043]|nr:hypothetical protein H0H87_004402 [Tephrocybe sp. NHM501043]